MDDSWQHGQDLYGVYHDLLGFLPDDVSEKVSFRVTQNVITSEVAGMVINGMFNTQNDVPLLVEVMSFQNQDLGSPNKTTGQRIRLSGANLQLFNVFQLV